MGPELLTPDNLSVEGLHALFEAAMLDTYFDEGRLIVKDAQRILVDVCHGMIRLCRLVVLKEGVTEAAAHSLCGRINEDLIVIRASLYQPGLVMLDWFIPTQGGITKKAVVAALRRFIELVPSIIEYDKEDVVR